MRRLAVLCLTTLVATASLAPSVAHAAGVSLGCHLGLASIEGPDEGGTNVVLAWPSNALSYQPALRLAVGDQKRAHEVIVDTGMLLIDEAGSVLTLFALSGGYQYTFRAGQRYSPYANASVGLFREGGAGRAGSSTSWGGGIGLRHVVRDRHGALRIEGRVDRVAGSHDFGRPALTTLGLRLGFDLWL